MLTILDAIHDRSLFGASPVFADLQPWKPWLTFLSAVYGLPLDAEGVERKRSLDALSARCDRQQHLCLFAAPRASALRCWPTRQALVSSGEILIRPHPKPFGRRTIQRGRGSETTRDLIPEVAHNPYRFL